jgi:hypothetical protein
MTMRWRHSRVGATPDLQILPECGNISSIISGNAPSSMAGKARAATID